MTTIFNYSTLGKFRQEMYESLLYKHHLSIETPKLVEFKGDEYEAMQGYLFVKDNKKYLLKKEDEDGKDNFEKLPVRVLRIQTCNAKNNDVLNVLAANQCFRSFRITPEKVFPFQELVDIDGIIHQDMQEWTLWKIICWAARLSRIAIRFSAIKRFGKTSYIDILNFLLDKAQVINRPRTVPGICRYINPDGLIAMDEMGQLPADIRHEIQSMLFQLGSFSNYLTLGSAGSSAYKTKSKYDIQNLSCIVLYNRIEDYEKKEHFFDFMFSNNSAINDRFLPLRPSDTVLDMDQFTGGSTIELTEEHKKLFMAIMKTAEYYNQNWIKLIDNAKVDDMITQLKVEGRHQISFRNILCFIQMYADKDEEMFKQYAFRLKTWYETYLNALDNNEMEADVEEIKIE